jgi:hypothetical protein
MDQVASEIKVGEKRMGGQERRDVPKFWSPN